VPNVAFIPPYQAAALARSERRVSRLLRHTHRRCDDVLHFRGGAKRAGEDRKSLAEQHPEFASADLRAVAVHWVMVWLPVAIWLVDVCLLSSVSEYLATLIFPTRPEMVLAARLLVASAVVGVEVGLSVRLHTAHESADETENRVPYWACWAGVVAWAAFLAACLVATQQAAGAEEEVSTRTLMYGLAGFCFLLHLLLPFCHELQHEAKGYMLFRLRDSRLRGAERRARHEEDDARRETTATFQHYARDLNRHNALYPPPPLAAGPFAVAVRTVINEIFGEGTIPPPNQIQGGDAAAPAPPAPVVPANGNGGSAAPNPPTPADAPEAENEYLRAVLGRRQQDEESEVRP